MQEEWAKAKLANKVRLANTIEKLTGTEVSTDALFDIQVKRIHEYKRQLLNVLYVIHRFTEIRAMSQEERKKVCVRTFHGNPFFCVWFVGSTISPIHATICFHADANYI